MLTNKILTKSMINLGRGAKKKRHKMKTSVKELPNVVKHSNLKLLNVNKCGYNLSTLKTLTSALIF